MTMEVRARATPWKTAASMISLVSCVFALGASPAAADELPPSSGGAWGPIIAWPHVAVSMANLPDGRILTWASNERDRFPAGPEFTYAATWNPATGEFIELPHPSHDMFCASLVMTEDGRVFVTGGRNQAKSPWTSVFDFRDNSWTHLPDMNRGRWYPTSVALPTGGVFIAVGIGGEQYPELYTPGSGWKLLTGIDLTDALLSFGLRDGAGLWPLLQLDPRGDVFLHGATPGMYRIEMDGLGHITSLGPHGADWFPDEGVSIMYREGKILVAGGSVSITDNTSSAKAMVIDVNGPAPVVTPTGSMVSPRQFHNEIMLPTGEVLVVGGDTNGAKFNDDAPVLAAEMWDPDTGTWTLLNAQQVPRTYHSTALLLTDGRVLSAGGGLDGGNPAVNHWDGEVYSPPYLFGDDGSPAVRPVITDGPDLMRNGGVYTFHATEGIARYSLVKMSATTHTMNTDSRFVPVSFTTEAPGEYRLTMHSNPNVLTPGYWMLFAVDPAGVPSVSKVVQVVTTGVPRVVAPKDQYGRINDYVSLPISARDPDGDPLGYAATGLPASLSIDQATGEISGVLTEPGIYNVTVLIDDGVDVALTAFRWFVTSRSSHSEFGRETFTQGNANVWFPVDLQHLYFDPVIVVGPPTLAGGDPANMRVRDVQPASFEFQLDEWDYKDGPHVEETVSWMAVEAGAYMLPNDRALLAAHTADVGSAWKVETFPEGMFVEPPIVLAQVTTSHGTEAVNVRLDQITTAGFSMRLQEQESGDGDVAAERVDWIAIEPGKVAAEFEAALAPAVGSADAVLDFAVAYGTKPDFYASVQTIAEADPVAIRVRNHSPTHATVFLQEEGSLDAEVVHANEAVGYLAVGVDVEELSLLRLDNEAPTVTKPADVISVEGESVALLIDAHDPDGDPVTFGATGLPPGLAIDPLTGEVSGTVDTPGNYEVTVVVTDALEAVGQASFGWFVSERLELLPFPTPPVVAGDVVSYTAATSFAGDFVYAWDFSGTDTPVNATAEASARFTEPGRHIITVDVLDPLTGVTDSIQLIQMVVPAPTLLAPAGSGGVGWEPATGRVWVVNPDNDSVSVVDGQSGALVAEIPVGPGPRAVAVAPHAVWVAQGKGRAITVIDPETLQPVGSFELPRASRPKAIVFEPGYVAAWVSLEELGSVVRLDALTGAQLGSVDVGPKPRGLALSADGATLYVSRFITRPLPGEATATPQTQLGGLPVGGEVVPVDTATLTAGAPIVLAHSEAETTEHSGPGIPNYLGELAISPDGRSGWVPSKQDNVLAGQIRSGSLLDFDSSVRAVSSRIDLGSGTASLSERIDHDDASVASVALYGRDGAYLFVALEGNRAVAVVDVLSGAEIGRFDCGRAPQGLALSGDGRTLYVHNFTDRTLSVHDLSHLIDYGSVQVPTLVTTPLVAAEALPAQILLGKQLFYDAADPRLSLNGYMACAACHNDGGQDGRVWDFTQFGEGLRNTIALDGHGHGNGPLHWTANFDEVQDFEGQIRAFAGGAGLMSDEDFYAGTRSTPLGDPKAGLSEDLDALAAYVVSLTQAGESAFRGQDGELTPLGVEGRAVFAEAGCGECHAGAAFTQSASLVKHDIGTLSATSGAGAAAGLDVPTLRGTWGTAPYLHDGSAATLGDAILAHDGVSLTDGELSALVSYLQQIDDAEGAADATCTLGGECTCDPGFYGDAVACFRCEEVAHCVGGLTCTDALDSQCDACEPGYRTPDCADIDECADGTDDCDPTAVCTNLGGGYECACVPGTFGDGFTCEACAPVAHCAGGLTCTGAADSECAVCLPGYALMDGHCFDIDECATNADQCDAKASCTNTEGGYECTCEDGLYGDGKTCEPCTAVSHCTGAVVCSDASDSTCDGCAAGYSGPTCQDVDECGDQTDDCDANAACANTDGAYECTCNDGFHGDGQSCEACAPLSHCQGGLTCTGPDDSQCGECAAGYAAPLCEDIDECDAVPGPCDPSATCTNDDGGFACACPAGAFGDGFTCEPCGAVEHCTGQVTCTDASDAACDDCAEGYGGADCQDLDECADGTDTCAPDAVCSNTDGGYDCACLPGFYGDGQSCQGCAAVADCTGQVTCTGPDDAVCTVCAPGYSGPACADIDECADDTDTCAPEASCTNTDGGYDCACLPGFFGDGQSCQACSAVGHCTGAVTCTTAGDSACDGCALGYAGPACADVDECADGADTCAPDAACTNTDGGFECACLSGFYGDGQSCAACAAVEHCAGAVTCTSGADSVCDLCAPHYSGPGCAAFDECAAHADTCAPEATCADTADAYECVCNDGYYGDGETCQACSPVAHCEGAVHCTGAGDSVCESCEAGYGGAACVDVDECAGATAACDPDATCTNREGGYDCTCKVGFFGDGESCQACPEVADCVGVVTCTTALDASCSECASGFERQAGLCAPIDPCQALAGTCGDHATCQSSAGGVECVCDAGYLGDGESCTTCTEADFCSGEPACQDMEGVSCGCSGGGGASSVPALLLALLVLGVMSRRRRAVTTA
ncbi:MAG: DUF1929 domain-containing protein [Deltaproteobacteria bacterium]|nr:DUF1929 domain-containing protein [Deltaproteobacteria bacterium]